MIELSHPVHRLTYNDKNHAYYVHTPCALCDATGIVPGARAGTTKKCPDCKGQTELRTRPASVTTVLGLLAKPALIPWAARLAADHARERLTEMVGTGVLPTLEDIDRICSDAQQAHNATRDTAADQGSAVHDAIQSYGEDVFTAAPPDDPEAAAAFRSFVGWYAGSGLDLVEAERMVCDAYSRFAGRFDMLLRDRHTGGLVVADVKTSSGIYYEAVLQLAAYSMALNSEGGERVERSVILWVPKDGRPAVPLERDQSSLTNDIDAFHSLLAVHGHRRRVEPLLRSARRSSDEAKALQEALTT